nr:Dihydrofolate reductase [uncultured bacterium]
MISMIVAQSDNRVIGNGGDQPFYLPADLKRFRELTTGHTVVMGRRTFEAIMNRLGKPLPDRTNIVISRTLEPGEGYTVVRSLKEAMDNLAMDSEAFIIGGATVYEQALPMTDRLYMTRVDANLPGDTFFPELDSKEWKLKSDERHESDDKNPYDYNYLTYERKR